MSRSSLNIQVSERDEGFGEHRTRKVASEVDVIINTGQQVPVARRQGHKRASSRRLTVQVGHIAPDQFPKSASLKLVPCLLFLPGSYLSKGTTFTPLSKPNHGIRAGLLPLPSATVTKSLMSPSVIALDFSFPT